MLTIRQFFGGKSVWVVTVLAFLPALFGMIYWFDSGDNPPAYFLSENIYRPLVIAHAAADHGADPGDRRAWATRSRTRRCRI